MIVLKFGNCRPQLKMIHLFHFFWTSFLESVLYKLQTHFHVVIGTLINIFLVSFGLNLKKI